ncbi:MAG: hypothetical protein R3314_12195, partial [Longimicrobiales bacterium]|nr:hypothetical protein [Longimicrobiales bacterium]
MPDRVPTVLAFSGLLALGGLMATRPAAAQQCGPGSAVGGAAGYAGYAVAGGIDGAQYGADASIAVGSGTLQLSGRLVALEGAAPDPVLGRGRATYPLVAVRGVALCGDAHAGVSRFAVADDTGVVLAGGLGVTLEPARTGTVRPWLSVRGLGGRATGTVLGVDTDATGLAVGVEAGLELELGPVAVRLSGARDGFAGGLGPTPYPETSLALAVG